MFETLNQIKEAWNDSRFILVYDSGDRENEIDMIIPSQHVEPGHVANMRLNAGGLICTALTDEICRIIDLPFMSNIYKGIGVRYPILEKMLNHGLPYGATSSFSVAVNHVDSFTGITDKDRALTISMIGELLDLFKSKKITAKELAIEFGNSFRLPGHVPLLRGAHGLMRRRKGHTELSLALCEITNQGPSTTMCEMMNAKTGKALSVDDAQAFAIKNNFPFVEGKQIIHLWRSIQKIPKDEIIGD